MAGWGSIHQNTLYSMSHQMETLRRIQEQIASGSKVIRASDAPSDAFRILSLQADEMRYRSYLNNLGTVGFNLSHVASGMQNISANLATIRSRVVQAGTDTYSASDRRAIGEEIDSLLEQTINIVNTPNSGRYLFGGTNTSSPSFSVERENGRIVRTIYGGHAQPLRAPVGPRIEMNASVVGEKVFRQQGSQTPQFLGSTGAMPGHGTSTIRGHVWLEIAHTQTVYQNQTPPPPHDSGIRAGDSSSSGDTLLGHHTLTIDTSTGTATIRLNDGPPVEFTPGATDLQLTSPSGQVVHVDVSGWDGADAVVQLHAQAEMSIDGGLTRVAADGSANQAVVDSRSGQVLYVDTSGLTAPGAEPVRVQESYDLFETLIHLRDLLLNGRGLSHQEQTRLLDQAKYALETVHAGVTSQLTAVGGMLQASETMQMSMDNLVYNAQVERSALQSADVAQLAADLAQAQTYYQMVLATSGKLLNLSLLNYIR